MKEPYWIRASRLEQAGRLEEALRLYLEGCKHEEDLMVAAISLLSAARCAVKLGRIEEAIKLFRDAGKRYEELAKLSEGSSPNMAKWAYGMASRCYQLAGDTRRSLDMLKRSGATD